MKFSLATIAYVFALLAAGIAAFGPGPGLFLSAMVLVWWALVWWSKLTVVELLILGAVLGFLTAGLLYPAVSKSHERNRISYCRTNLQSIAAAVVRYREDFGRLPRAVAPQDPKTPMASWRTDILRYLEEQDLLDQYIREEPWNGATNAVLTSAPLMIYCCPSDPIMLGTASTSYFAIVDSRTVWGQYGELGEPKDDRDQTLMLIEAAGMNTPWAAPRDLTFNEAIALLTKGSSQVVHAHSGWHGFFYKNNRESREGVHVAFASGRVAFLPLPISKKLATALLTSNGGEKIDGELEDPTMPEIDYGKIYAFAAFMGLALLPGVRSVWRAWRCVGSPAGC